MSTKKILMIIAPSQFRDEELFVPQAIFTQAGYVVDIASKGVQRSKGVMGKEAVVSCSFDAVKAEGYDAVILVGGGGAQVYWEDISLHSFLKEAYNGKKVIGAECIAPDILANAGLLTGKKATVWKSEGVRLQAKGVQYTGESVTVDGSIVTSNGPQAAEAFARKIASLLEKKAQN